MSTIDVLMISIPPEMIHNWGWLLALGIGLVALGTAAIVRSVKATVASMSFIGWLLVIAAGIEVTQAFLVGNWAGFFMHVLAAVLFGVTGVLFVTRPVISAEVVTLFMAMFFLVSGLYQLVGALVIHMPGWGWHALNGIIACVLGGMVLGQWPVSGLWAIGLFVGIDLVLNGWAWISLALALHKM